MTLAPSANNYLYGAGKLYFKATGDTGYLEIGNVPVFEVMMEPEEQIEHWESQTNKKLKDVSDILSWSVKSAITLEEYSAENLNIVLSGDGVQSLGNQAASYLTDVSTATVADQYVDLGYTDLTYLKLSHGAITSSPFVDAEVLTGGTSSATAKIVSMLDTSFLLVVNVAGTFVAGETITGAGGANAVCSAVETFNGAVVADAAVAANIWVEGTDYTIDPVGGLLRELSTGSIVANGVYVSADYAAKTNKTIQALEGGEAEGELLFIGNPKRGPRWRVNLWTCKLNISGPVSFITEEAGQITLDVEVLSDSSNHPNSPYFNAVEAS